MFDLSCPIHTNARAHASFNFVTLFLWFSATSEPPTHQPRQRGRRTHTNTQLHLDSPVQNEENTLFHDACNIITLIWRWIYGNWPLVYKNNKKQKQQQTATEESHYRNFMNYLFLQLAAGNLLVKKNYSQSETDNPNSLCVYPG